jgi:branched-chain amino acid transport system ATP-binding protein
LQPDLSGYGRIRIVDGVSLSMAAGEVVGLVGHNGMGKTTLLRTLIGHLPVQSGRFRFDGADVTAMTPASRALRGLGYVPQGRQTFPDLTVLENQRIGEAMRAGPSDIGATLQRFPPLVPLLARPGRALSGGEQQLLALAGCLLGRPKAILLDEPSEGTQPSIVEQIATHLEALADQGMAILLVEQDVHLIIELARRVLVMRKGQITEIAADDLANSSVRRELLGF